MAPDIKLWLVSSHPVRFARVVLKPQYLGWLALCIAGAVGCRTYGPPKVEPIPPPSPVFHADSNKTYSPEAQTAATGLGLESSTWPTNWMNTWVSLADWAAFNGLNPPKLVNNGARPTFELQTRLGKLALTVGSQVAYFNDIGCWLSYKARLADGAPQVYGRDAQKTLEPLLQTDHAFGHSVFTVVLDPGHGGQDTGSLSVQGAQPEKDFTLDWALRIGRLLPTDEWRVVLTRTNDQTRSLAERVAVADRVQADLFVSLHFNSGPPNDQLSGLETYCLTPTGLPSNLVRDATDDPERIFPNNQFDAANMIWAYGLHRALVLASGAVDRGLRRARFLGVLRWQQRPAVLLEAGYLSNTQEAARIGSAAYRQILAEAVARALVHGVTGARP